MTYSLNSLNNHLHHPEMLSVAFASFFESKPWSKARYRKTADMTVTGEWMQSFVARASFNLGFMHQFGIGIAQDTRDVEAFVVLVASCLV